MRIKRRPYFENKNCDICKKPATFFRATDESVLEDKYKIFRTTRRRKEIGS